jgi:hypothetical protein
LREELLSDGGRAAALKAVVDRVVLRADRLHLVLSLVSVVPASAQPLDPEASLLSWDLPLGIKRRGVEMRLVIEGPGPEATPADPVLLKEIRRAHRCFDALVSGQVQSVAELAALEGVSDRYISSLLPLAFLAPDIIAAIVSGKQPTDLTAHRLIRHLDLPINWTTQKQLLGFA